MVSRKDLCPRAEQTYYEQRTQGSGVALSDRLKCRVTPSQPVYANTRFGGTLLSLLHDWDDAPAASAFGTNTTPTAPHTFDAVQYACFTRAVAARTFSVALTSATSYGSRLRRLVIWWGNGVRSRPVAQVLYPPYVYSWAFPSFLTTRSTVVK